MRSNREKRDQRAGVLIFQTPDMGLEYGLWGVIQATVARVCDELNIRRWLKGMARAGAD
jgi:hypothetical protein